MVEPIQGEAGVIIPKNDYLNKVQEYLQKEWMAAHLRWGSILYGENWQTFCS